MTHQRRNAYCLAALALVVIAVILTGLFVQAVSS